MSQLLVGLPTVTVLGVVDDPGSPIVVVIETLLDLGEHCSVCSSLARIKERDPVLLTDLPAFGLRNFVHWRIRVLLYAGKPDWSKLPTVTP